MRRWGPVAVLVLAVLVPPHPLTAQTGSGNEQAATDTAMLLSRMEATGHFDSLYDLMHPDAQALIPPAAVAGWYTHEFTPRGPGTITVTGVTFGAWTWGVTGHTYPTTAEVAFTQPFADGSVVTDVVRLVQDDSGTWRWFFGRDRAFVEAQIAAYVPVPPLSALTTLLPTVDDVEGGLVVSEEGNRTEEELATTFLNPPVATQRLDAWGWQQNAYRFFAAPGDALPSGSTASIEVSLHRFRSPFGAADALPYFAAERAQALGLGKVPITPVGDQVQEIAGPVDAGNEVTLYVRTGDVLVRVSAVTPAGDPTGDALAAVDAVLARASIPVSPQAVAPTQATAVPTPPPSTAPTPAIVTPTPLAAEGGTNDQPCQAFIDQESTLGFRLTADQVTILTGCRQDMAGRWFLPTGPDDPRLVGGPPLTAEEARLTAPLRQRIEAQLADLAATLDRYPDPNIPSNQNRGETMGDALDELRDPTIPGVNPYDIGASSVVKMYEPVLVSYLRDPNHVALGSYVWWWGTRRVAVGDSLCAGQVSIICQTIRTAFQTDRPPLPWELADPLTLDTYLDWALTNGYATTR